MASPAGGSFRRNTANELDVLLDDLSNARYAGGQRTFESQRSEEYSSSIVQQLNGYHPQSQVVPSDSSSTRHHKQSKAVIRELESLMTEEETVIEETQQYRVNFGSSWDENRPRKSQHTSTTTVYATIAPPSTTIYAKQQEEELEELLTHQTVFWRRLRQEDAAKPVEMPLDTTVPILVQELHEEFDKSGVREAQRGQGYRSKLIDEVGEAEEEEEKWVMPELPEPTRRLEPICAACTKSISGRCITAMMRKFHPEHFVCSYCLRQLNKGTFKEREDKPYCQECFYRLFG